MTDPTEKPFELTPEQIALCDGADRTIIQLVREKDIGFGTILRCLARAIAEPLTKERDHWINEAHLEAAKSIRAERERNKLKEMLSAIATLKRNSDDTVFLIIGKRYAIEMEAQLSELKARIEELEAALQTVQWKSSWMHGRYHVEDVPEMLNEINDIASKALSKGGKVE